MQEYQEISRISPLSDDLISWRLDKRKVANELDLFTSKWFDYRMLTPLQATGVYVAEMAKAFRRVHARHLSRRASEHVHYPSMEMFVQILEKGERTEKERFWLREFTGCFAGRQVADAIGIPYDVYIDRAFHHRLRHWKQNRLPRSTQLYLDWIVEKVVDDWEEMKASRMILADHPAYMSQNYASLGHQDDYHEYLFEIAEARPEPHIILADHVNRDRLPLDKVEARYSDSDFMVERIHRHLI